MALWWIRRSSPQISGIPDLVFGDLLGDRSAVLHLVTTLDPSTYFAVALSLQVFGSALVPEVTKCALFTLFVR